MASSTSSPSTSPPLTRADCPNFPVCTPANLGYGFIVDTECLRRWAKVFYEQAFGPEALSSMSPEEVEDALQTAECVATTHITHMVYKRFPRIPRLHRRLVLTSPLQGRWLLVLKDNSSREAVEYKLLREDVAGVRNLMGFGEQRPMWYRIPS